MALREILVEIRPQIFAGCVFLRFDAKREEIEKIRMNIDETSIRLVEGKKETVLDFSKFFIINSKAIRDANAEDNHADFCITLKAIVGSLLFAPPPPTIAMELSPTINIIEGSIGCIVCRNCSTNLMMEHQFELIKDFPDEDSDANKLFCYSKLDVADDVQPCFAELYYGFHYIVVNKKLILNNIKEKGDHIYCWHCLTYLGCTLSEDRLVAKLWTDMITFRNDVNVLTEIFTESQQSICSTLLKNLIAIAQRTIGDPANKYITKILLESTYADRKRRYLMLKILDSQLNVLHRKIESDGDSVKNSEKYIINPKLKNCLKMEYFLVAENDEFYDKDENGSGDGHELDTIQFPPSMFLWKIDAYVIKHAVSPTLFTTLIKKLKKNKTIFSEKQRMRQENFEVSYVNV